MKLKSGFFLFAFLILCGPSFAKEKAGKPSDRGIMHNNKGVTALYDGDIDRALFEFKTATELAPTYPEAWSNLGLAYKFKGRLDDAEVAIKKAISLDKKFASAYNHLGVVYQAKGQYDEALKQFKLALKYNDKLSDAHYNAALVHLALYRNDRDKDHLLGAETELKNTTLVNSEHPQAHLELAKVYQEMGQYEPAIIRYKLALEINPNLDEAWSALAKLYTQTGQTLKAQQALNQAIAKNPDSPMAHLNMGLNYLKDDNFRMAVNEFNKVIRADPTHELAYFNIGFAFYKLGADAQLHGNVGLAQQSFTQSNAAYESAFKLRPTFTEAAYNIGYNYQNLKDFANAVAWYKKAIVTDARYATAYFQMGSSYRLQGNNTEAARAYCDFVKLKPQNLVQEVQIAQDSIKSLGGCP